MSQRRGLIKFVLETKKSAIIEESAIIQTGLSKSVQIGTGNASNKTFSGTLISDKLGSVKPGTLVIKVNGSQITASDTQGTSDTSVGTIAGAGLTGTGSINYRTSVISFVTSATPGSGVAVTVEFQQNKTNSYFDTLKLVHGNFSSRNAEDVIFYNYDSDSQLGTGLDITETYD